jgi:hypothetical protein
MEMWTEEELADAKAKLGEVSQIFSLLPETLCGEDDMWKERLNSIWQDYDSKLLNVYKLKRTEVFGMQARTYFCSSEKMIGHVERLISGFSQVKQGIAQADNVLEKDTTVKASHRFINLCYEPRIRFFYEKMASLFLGRFVVDILKRKIQKANFDNTNIVKASDVASYASSFEQLVSLSLTIGASFDSRNYWETARERIHFSSCVYDHFSYSVRNNIFIYKNLSKHTYMVRDRLTESVMLVCEKKFLATVDQIVLRPPPEGTAAPVVEFFQCTTSPGHTVSPYSFFSMILLILSLKDVYNVVPVVRFIFAVPLDAFENFTSAEDYNLVNVWPLMEIKVVEIYYPSSSGGAPPSPESSSPSNKVTPAASSNSAAFLSSHSPSNMATPAASSNSGASLSSHSPSNLATPAASSSSSLSGSSSSASLSLLEYEEFNVYSDYYSKAFHLTGCQLCKFIPTADVDWGVVKFELSQFFVKQKGDKNALEFLDPSIGNTSMEKEKDAANTRDDDDFDGIWDMESSEEEKKMPQSDVNAEFKKYYDKLHCSRKGFYPRLLKRHRYHHHFLVKCVLNNISHEDVFSLVAHLCLNVRDVAIDDSTKFIKLIFANEGDLNKAVDFFEEMLRDVFVIQSRQCLLLLFIYLFIIILFFS